MQINELTDRVRMTAIEEGVMIKDNRTGDIARLYSDQQFYTDMLNKYKIQYLGVSALLENSHIHEFNI